MRVLALGDSITNGGVTTPQDLTYPMLLQAELAGAGIKSEVLNASAGGWALENELGWIEANGLYGCDFVVHQVATHDLHQRLSPSSLVDRHPSFPSRLPRLGLQYVFQRRVLPHIRLRMQLADPGAYQVDRTPEDIDRAFRVLDRVRFRVEAAGATLIVLHVEQPQPLEPHDLLTVDAKARLVTWCRESGTPLVQTAERLEAGGGRRLFMDHMHPTSAGNVILASAVSEALLPLLETPPLPLPH